MGLSYKTKEEVWEAGKRAMEENAEETYAANAKSAVVRKVVEESTIESVPEYLIEEEAQNYNHYIESLAKSMYNMDLETFVTNAYGVTMEQYNLEMNEMFTDTVRQYLVMEAIARAEKMEITEEMIAKKADEEATEYGYASKSPQHFLPSHVFLLPRLPLLSYKKVPFQPSPSVSLSHTPQPPLFHSP